jgi:hypothetical protein
MALPELLAPTATELLRLTNGEVMGVPKSKPVFTPWSGRKLRNSFGKKPLLLHAGERCFAELVVLRLFQAAGWSGRWVVTFGAPRTAPRFVTAWKDSAPKTQTNVPVSDFAIQSLLGSIVQQNRHTYSGCWDVIAWNGSHLLFAEAKQKGHDRVLATQLRWFESAIATGLTVESFLVVEWSFL